MAFWHERSKRKRTGGKYKDFRKRKRFQRGSTPVETGIGSNKVLKKRVRGGNLKLSVKRTETAIVVNQKTRKVEKAKIEAVVENSANREFVRRNIITKGAVLKTDKGLAKVTSRPGQHGVINAVLVD